MRGVAYSSVMYSRVISPRSSVLLANETFVIRGMSAGIDLTKILHFRNRGDSSFFLLPVVVLS